MFNIPSDLIQSGYILHVIHNNINCWRLQNMFINPIALYRPYKVTYLLSYFLPISSFQFRIQPLQRLQLWYRLLQCGILINV